MSVITRKKLVIIRILLVIAIIHVINPDWTISARWHELYSSYFSDLVIPYGFYFLLCAAESNIPWLRPCWLKFGLVFGAATTAEILQYFGIHALGKTFDPLDIGMYAVGTLLAVIVEQRIFSRYLSFWTVK